MKKFYKILKYLTIIFGIVLLIAGILDGTAPKGDRIFYFLFGVFLICVATFATLRNALISLTAFGVSMAGLKSVVTADGNLNISYLLLVVTFLCIAIYFGQKVIRTFPAIRFSHLSNIDLSDIDSMTGLEFEQFTADLLSIIGYSHVRVTKASGDHGIDVLAYKDGYSYAIQCKNYTHKLDNSPVQEAYAGKDFYHCDVGVVLTNSTFTNGACELANAVGVLLWDRQILQEMLQQAHRKHSHKESAGISRKAPTNSGNSLTADDIISPNKEHAPNISPPDNDQPEPPSFPNIPSNRSTTKNKRKQLTADSSYIAQAQWYASRDDADFDDNK